MNDKKNKKKNERTLKLWTKKKKIWMKLTWKKFEWKRKRKIKTKPKQSYRQNERPGSTENDKGWRKDEHYVQ